MEFEKSLDPKEQEVADLIVFLPGIHHTELAQAFRVDEQTAFEWCQKLEHQPKYIGIPSEGRLLVAAYLIDCWRRDFCPNYSQVAQATDLTTASARYSCAKLGYRSPQAHDPKLTPLKKAITGVTSDQDQPLTYAQRQMRLAELGTEASRNYVRRVSEESNLHSPKALKFDSELLVKTTLSLGEIALELSQEILNQAKELVVLLPNLHPLEIGNILSLDWETAQEVCRQINHQTKQLGVPCDSQQSVAKYVAEALLTGERPSYAKIGRGTNLSANNAGRYCRKIGYQSPQIKGPRITNTQLAVEKVIKESKKKLSISQIYTKVKQLGIETSLSTVYSICERINYTTRTSYRAPIKETVPENTLKETESSYLENLGKTQRLLEVMPGLHPIEVSAILDRPLEVIEEYYQDSGLVFDLTSQPSIQSQKVSLYLGNLVLANKKPPYQKEVAKEIRVHELTVQAHYQRLGYCP